MRIGWALWALLVSALVGRAWAYGLSQCGLPCGEVSLADGQVWDFATPDYPTWQTSPPDSWCLCEWIIHAPSGKNVTQTLDKKDFYVDYYFFVSDKGGGEGVPLAVLVDSVSVSLGDTRKCGLYGYWPSGNCSGVVSGRGSLHLGLFNGPGRPYAFSLSVTSGWAEGSQRTMRKWQEVPATEEAASEPMKPIIVNPTHWPDMMNCTCPDGIFTVSPGKSVSIMSPGYPNLYPDFCNCEWTVTAPSVCNVSLAVADFATDPYGFDYLSVYDRRENGTGKDYQNLFWCAGDSCADRTVASHSVAIVFVSNDEGRYKGFSLDVSATDCTPCDVTPCRNGGTCTHSATEAFCACPSTSTGQRCEKLVCENGGTSGHNATDSWCTCPPHYSGQRCEDLVCENGGTSINPGSAPSCHCRPGYAGDRCQENFNPCLVCNDEWCVSGSNTCNKTLSSCTRLDNSTFQCTCPRPIVSTPPPNVRCSNATTCDDSTCLNGGTCMSLKTSLYCSCAPDRTGDRCQIPLNPASNKLLFDADRGEEDNSYKIEYGQCVPHSLEQPTRFMGSLVKNLTISPLGAIRFDGRCNDSAADDSNILACYWTPSEDYVEVSGKMYKYNVASNSAWSLRAASFVKMYNVNSKINTATLTVTVVTWTNLTFVNGSTKTEPSTFQCALISDGIESYVAYSFRSLGPSSVPGSNEFARTMIKLGWNNTHEYFERTLTLPRGVVISGTVNVNKTSLSSNFKSLMGMKAAGKFALAHILVKEPNVIDMSNYSNISCCKITNDPHYRTFDGKFFYQLAHKSKDNGYWMPQTPDIWVILAATTNCLDKDQVEQCPSKNHPPPFSIEMQPSGEKDLSLHAGPVRVRFYLATGREKTVYSNIELRLYDAYFVVVHVGNNAGTTHTTEWSCDKECGGGSGGYTFFQIAVGRSQNGWTVSTNFGVNVVTNYLSQVEIQLHNVSNYKGNLVGYCGNFNGDPNDDLACFNSTVLSYFGYCWQSKYLNHLSDGAYPGCLKCQQSHKSRPGSTSQSLWSTGPSPWITSKQKELGETHCNASLKNNEAFKDCLTTTSFAANFNMCVTDVGRTGNHLSTHCLILANTARDCIVERPNASIPLHFSNNTCDPHCWTNSTWKVKMSSCPNTCEKPNAENFCRLPDSSGCECEEGLLLKDKNTAAIAVYHVGSENMWHKRVSE